MVVAEPHDAEGGDGALNSERATTSSQYGAAEGAHARPAQSRAWAFGTVVLMCALVGTAHWAQGVRQTPRELMARGRETYAGQSLHSKIPPPDDYSRKKMSFVKGESHMMNDVLSAESSRHELEDHVYQLIHPSLLAELQHEIEREMAEEVQEAVDKEQQEYYLRNTANIQREMGAVMKDVDAQKSINTQFSAMVKRAKSLEKEICTGESCEDWDSLLAGAQKKVDALSKELATERKTHRTDLDRIREEDQDLTADMSSDEQEALKVEQDLTYWRGLANVYYAMLHPRTAPAPVQTPPPVPPPPPHCSGLKLIYGAAGSISSGPAGTATDLDHNDCRWIIKSPNPEIVLRFPKLAVFGAEGRVSIFVGPENVELYKDQDVVSWSSAYKSFTGRAYPAPIVCPAGEVLVIFHTAAGDASKSEFDMTWTSGVEASARALVEDALESSVHQQLAEVKRERT